VCETATIGRISCIGQMAKSGEIDYFVVYIESPRRATTTVVGHSAPSRRVLSAVPDCYCGLEFPTTRRDKCRG
jgi:hypothetical protein